MKLKRQICDFVDSTKENGEVRLKEFFLIFKAGRLVIWTSIAIFGTLGLIYSLTSPNQYTTTSQILTEQPRNISSRSQLGALAGLAGLSNGGGTEEVISADLYPVVLTNSNFLLELAEGQYYFEDEGQQLTLVEYFAKYEKTNWITSIKNYAFGSIMRLFRKRATPIAISNVLADTTARIDTLYRQLTSTQLSAIEKLKGRILIEKLDRIISISTKMPDPKVSAILNRKIIDYLIRYVTDVQTDRERKNFEFIEERLEEAENRVKRARMALADFRDSNFGLVFETHKSQIDKLQTELSLASNIYNTISQQHEQARIKRQESKPVLTVLQDPILPLTPSEPTVVSALIVFSILGFFVGLLIIGSKIVGEFFRKA